jgi:hypothetical protein
MLSPVHIRPHDVGWQIPPRHIAQLPPGPQSLSAEHPRPHAAFAPPRTHCPLTFA